MELPIILATWKAEAGGSQVRSQLAQVEKSCLKVKTNKLEMELHGAALAQHKQNTGFSPQTPEILHYLPINVNWQWRGQEPCNIITNLPEISIYSYYL